MDSRPVLAVLLAISWAVTCEGQLQCSKSCRSEDSYVAAVVEYHPEGNPRTDEARSVMELNLANYETFVVKAAKKGADIVVFPEYGLTHTWLSDHRKEITKYAQVVPAVHSGNDGDADVPCLQGNVSWVIQRLSCSARKNKIYVVVNIPEAVHCHAQDEDCPSDGFFIYNANIAFERNGAVVSKYHKYNLFLEPAINKPKKASLSTFSTDFNVTFGIFICFDILFKEPAFDLVNTEKITDIIYSTAWGSQLPFLAAVQFQASWSYGLGVNFLGSEYNDPERGFGGSGIYSGVKGPLLTYVPSKTGSQLLVACVPKINGKISPGLDAEGSCQREAMILPTSPLESVDISLRLLHEDISKYSLSSAFKDGEIATTVCSGEFCCQFYADIQLGDASNNSTYRFLAFDGVRKFGSVMYKGAIQVCSILYCLGDDFHTCGYIPEDNSDFKPVIRSLRISGNFDSSQMVLPNSVNFHLKPIPTESYNFIKDTEGFQFSSKDRMESILSISIYGRNFKGDGS